MPRRKQSNPQPVKAEDGAAPGCLGLESEVLLNGELELGEPETTGPDGDGGVGLDLGAELHRLACEESQQSSAPFPSSRKKRAVAEPGAPSRLFSCSLCSFTSRYSNHLKRHMRTHDGQKPYCCPVCPYASAQLVNLQRHLRTHTGEKPYGCPQCSYACSSLGNLRRHQRMHAQERPPRREKEKTRGGRRRKQEGGSDGELTPPDAPRDSAYLRTLGGLGAPAGPLPVLLFPLPCQLCGLSLEDADLQGDKGEADGGQVCCRCSPGAPPSADGAPAAPRGSRRRQRGHRCPYCPFLSRYPNPPSGHAHSHGEEKPHRCPHCPYASAHLDNLRRHTRVHTGEKPYQCPSCSYACGNLANLRRHERIHSGAKPFRCAVCGYSCNQSMNLKRHMLRHTGEKPYACGECRYTTGHWDNYKRHQRKHGHASAAGWDGRRPEPEEGAGPGER